MTDDSQLTVAVDGAVAGPPARVAASVSGSCGTGAYIFVSTAQAFAVPVAVGPHDLMLMAEGTPQCGSLWLKVSSL